MRNISKLLSDENRFTDFHKILLQNVSLAMTLEVKVYLRWWSTDSSGERWTLDSKVVGSILTWGWWYVLEQDTSAQLLITG